MEKTPRRGRPALDEDGGPSTLCTVRLPQKEFDQLYRRATRDRTTVAAVMRRDIRRGQADEPAE